MLESHAAVVASSPAVRCVATVEPFAISVNAAVHIDERLAEGGDAHGVVEWMCAHEGDDLVLCGHGDLLPEVLRLLQLRGMTLDGPGAVAKGSVWTCHIDAGVPVHASYTPPPTV